MGLLRKEWEEANKRQEEFYAEMKKQMDEFSKEIICSKCGFYFDKLFTHRHKGNRSYCHNCFYELQN